MKASCINCINCVPNNEASEKTDFTFPKDHECLLGGDCFLNNGHICVDLCDGDPFWKYETKGGKLLR